MISLVADSPRLKAITHGMTRDITGNASYGIIGVEVNVVELQYPRELQQQDRARP